MEPNELHIGPRVARWNKFNIALLSDVSKTQRKQETVKVCATLSHPYN